MSNISYLRFTISNNKGSVSTTNLTELGLATAANSFVQLSPLINSGATTSTPTPDPTYPIANLFNGGLSYTQWATNSTIVVTIQFNTPWSTATYPKYSLYINNGSIASSYTVDTDPNSFTVELSQDGTNWTTYSNVTNATFTNNTASNGGLTFFAFDSVCVAPNTKILMDDYTYKMISELDKNDKVIQDIKTGKIGVICRIIKSASSNCVLIPSNLLENKTDIIITGNHPVWINSDKARILAKNIKGVQKIDDVKEVYSIQFDEEGTFYANGVKVDSLSPYHRKFPLPKDHFTSLDKYINNYKVLNEDDLKRGKPPIISL